MNNIALVESVKCWLTVKPKPSWNKYFKWVEYSLLFINP